MLAQAFRPEQKEQQDSVFSSREYLAFVPILGKAISHGHNLSFSSGNMLSYIEI